MGDVIRVQRVNQTAVALCCALSLMVEGSWAAPMLGPVDLNGRLGFSLRTLSEDSGHEDSSQQMLGVVNAATYFGEPWLATTNLSLALTQDSSETSDTGASATTDSQIMTGDWGLAVLPRSKAPFNLNFQVSNSSVDREGLGQTPITFAGEEYSTTTLGLRQSYRMDNGSRFQFRYDTRSWESESSGTYDDTTIGAEADLRMQRHHLIGRFTAQTNEHTLSERANESQILDLSHYYNPSRRFRLDTKVSQYAYDRSFLDPSTNDTRLTATEITQLSSSAFVRPENRPWTLSASIRVMSMDGTQDTVATNDQEQLVLNGGLFYQLSKKIRLDASATSSFTTTAGVDQGYHRQHGGGLYQSDWHGSGSFGHQGYVGAKLDHVVDPTDDYIDTEASGGHNFGWTWWLGERTTPTSLRLNVNQALRYISSGALATNQATYQRLDHSLTMAFNQRVWSGNTLAQMTVSDYRNFGDSEEEQQMVHLQLSRDQDLGRRSSVVGDVTMQLVRYAPRLVWDEAAYLATGNGWVDGATDTTTTTARIKFQHSQLFSVPKLVFSSAYMISQVSTEGAVNRNDWDNRLAYSIGKLDTSLSYRLTETDTRNYDLLYFRIMRRF